MARTKLSKAQASKEVRRVLARYQVDLTAIRFSASTHSIHLNGYLIKASGYDFQVSVVQTMTSELLRIATIRCELENWNIGSEGVNFIGKAEKSNKAS